LASIEYLRPAAEVPRGLHERWDGAGYPAQLRGEFIPLSARIVAVAACWAALRAARLSPPPAAPFAPAPAEPHRATPRLWTDAQIQSYLRAQSGTRFDPRVVMALLSMDWPEAA
jgi:response regulator RpfG family c-di-GMP phosphodiesterase